MSSPVVPWGNHMWHAMHYVALGYPEHPTKDDLHNYALFYNSPGNVLPCRLCTGHFLTMLQEDGVEKHLSTKDELFDWTVRIHNKVNERLNKPIVSSADAKHYYMVEHPSNFYSNNYQKSLTKSSLNGGKLLVFLVMAITIALLLLLVVWLVWRIQFPSKSVIERPQLKHFK
jgi:hypothetical protein